jgi:hypothetical protein
MWSKWCQLELVIVHMMPFGGLAHTWSAMLIANETGLVRLLNSALLRGCGLLMNFSLLLYYGLKSFIYAYLLLLLLVIPHLHLNKHVNDNSLCTLLVWLESGLICMYGLICMCATICTRFLLSSHGLNHHFAYVIPATNSFTLLRIRCLSVR